jgi:hypothetical protein
MFEGLVIGADLESTDHPSVLRAVEGFQRWSQLEPVLQRLEAAVSQHDARAVRDLVMGLSGHRTDAVVTPRQGA